MNQVTCKDNVVVTLSGNTIHCSNGDCYVVNGTVVSGPGMNNTIVDSVQEAFGMIIGLHGGRLF